MANVLMLCKAYPPVAGGVETFSEQVALAHARRGHKVRVVTQTEGPRGWTSRVSGDVAVDVFNTGPGGQIATARGMRRAIRSGQLDRWADVIHATTWRPVLVSLRGRTPLVISVHGREILVTNLFLRLLMRLVFKRASSVVAVSSFTRSKGLTPANLPDAANWAVAGNGLSYRSEAEETPLTTHRTGPLQLLTLARLVERKNVQGALQALARLRSTGRDEFRYTIAGTGPMRPALEALSRELGLSDYVQFLGYVEDDTLPTLYRSADVFLHPQIATLGGKDFEGFGLTIADSMSFGCAAVAGANAGPDDFIENERTGFLVAGAEIDRLTELLVRLYDDPNLALEIGRAGRQEVLHSLSWDKHVDIVWETLSPSVSGEVRPFAGSGEKQ